MKTRVLDLLIVRAAADGFGIILNRIQRDSVPILGVKVPPRVVVRAVLPFNIRISVLEHRTVTIAVGGRSRTSPPPDIALTLGAEEQPGNVVREILLCSPLRCVPRLQIAMIAVDGKMEANPLVIVRALDAMSLARNAVKELHLCKIGPRARVQQSAVIVVYGKRTIHSIISSTDVYIVSHEDN